MQENKNRSNARLQVNSYIETTRLQEERRERRVATVLMGVLSALLPPIGLALVWHSRRVNTAMRVALSVVALFCMTLIGWLWMRPSSSAGVILPVPVVPDHAGYDVAAVEPTVVPVEVVYTVPESPTAFTVTYGDGTIDETMEFPVDPASYVTIVYAVANNATRYHNLDVCDGQSNPRVLTLEEAIAEGLQPCEKCVLSDDAAG